MSRSGGDSCPRTTSTGGRQRPTSWCSPTRWDRTRACSTGAWRRPLPSWPRRLSPQRCNRTGAGDVVPLDPAAWADALVSALGDRPLPPPTPPTGHGTARGDTGGVSGGPGRTGAGRGMNVATVRRHSAAGDRASLAGQAACRGTYRAAPNRSKVLTMVRRSRLTIGALVVAASTGHVLYPAWLALPARHRRAVPAPEPDHWPQSPRSSPPTTKPTASGPRSATSWPTAIPVRSTSWWWPTATSRPLSAPSRRERPWSLPMNASASRRRINLGFSKINAPVVVMSDANNTLAPGAIAALVRHLQDPRRRRRRRREGRARTGRGRTCTGASSLGSSDASGGSARPSDWSASCLPSGPTHGFPFLLTSPVTICGPRSTSRHAGTPSPTSPAPRPSSRRCTPCASSGSAAPASSRRGFMCSCAAVRNSGLQAGALRCRSGGTGWRRYTVIPLAHAALLGMALRRRVRGSRLARLFLLGHLVRSSTLGTPGRIRGEACCGVR